MRVFNSSLDADSEMLREDIDASKAHARELARLGILSEAELSEVLEGLEKVYEGIRSGELPLDLELEDIHMNVEVLLGRFTAAASRLHTARSRNDQVVTDFRLYCSRNAARLAGGALRLAEVFRGLAKRHAKAIMPEYTHGQRAQVSTLGHHLLAYTFMFLRDTDRFLMAHKSAARSALGSGACVGVGYEYNREAVARELGMYPPIESSLDAVSDRDFASDLLYACAVCAGHLSRLGAEWVLWSSAEFGYVRLPEDFCSGSSIMPQKRNPDAAELLRGLAPAVAGDMTGLLNLVSRIPLGYFKDLQGDKKPVMRSVRAVRLALEVAQELVAQTEFDVKRMMVGAQDLGLFATDIVDALVAKRIPFREAHERVGKLMRQYYQTNRDLRSLLKSHFGQLLTEEEMKNLTDPVASIERRPSLGGPSAQAMRLLLSRSAKEIRTKRRAIQRVLGL